MNDKEKYIFHNAISKGYYTKNNNIKVDNMMPPPPPPSRRSTMIKSELACANNVECDEDPAIEEGDTVDLGTSIQHQNIQRQLERNRLVHVSEMRNPNVNRPILR
jgi:hypothetical protein